MIARVRKFFDDRQFFEVETPLLSHDIVVDRYIEPLAISKSEVTGRGDDQLERMWLQTSPEFSMKRLLAAGADAIYQVGKCFRRGEAGARHNPEFSMLEWYRVGDDLCGGMQLLSELIESVLARPAAQCISYRELFRTQANVDPFTATAAELQQALRARGIEFAQHAASHESHPEVDREGWLNLMMSAVIEPQLGFERPVIVFDWPASQAALAIVRDEVPAVAERFEMFVDGMELANGYHELLDADELLRRNFVNNELRKTDGVEPLPSASRLLDAMRAGLPACAGVALGLDRLAMLAEGCQRIADVIAFPIDRA